MKTKSFKLLWIAVILLLAVLLVSAIAYFASPMRRIKIVESAMEIPDGWEIVSQAHGVTHIRMQEGADAYRWVVEQDQQKDFYLDVALAGNPGRNSMKPDENGKYHVVVYVGYNQAEVAEGMRAKDYRLIYFNRETEVNLYSFNLETVSTQKNVVYNGAQVGLTEAFIYSIPESDLPASNALMVWRVRSTYTDAEGTRMQKFLAKESVEYTLLDGMMHFDSQYADATQGKNSLLLLLVETLGGLLAPFFGVAVLFVLVWAILWGIRCIRKRRHPLLVPLPCMVGAVYAGLVMHFYNSLSSGLAYLGEFLWALYIAYAFLHLAVILLIVRLIVGKIQKRKDEKKVQETAQSEE